MSKISVFKLHKTYKTKSGQVAEVIAIRETKIAVIHEDDTLRWHTRSGKFHHNGEKSPYDLVKPRNNIIKAM